MCISPLTIKNDYRPMKDRYSEAARVVPCGKCVLCLKRRQNSWAFRLDQEKKRSSSAVFLTLTYERAPTSLNGLPTLRKRDFQLFMKRIRKKLRYISTEPLKYYACGEYGRETARPHYHAIMFNLPLWIIQEPNLISLAWGHGHIQLDPANTGSIRYVTKYIMKGGVEHNHCQETGLMDDRQPEFSLMSKKMGLNYLTPQVVKFHLDNMMSYITLPGGTLTSMPRYFRDRIFSREERKQLSAEAEIIRDLTFDKLFGDDYVKHYEWRKDQIRKADKAIQTERNKL